MLNLPLTNILFRDQISSLWSPFWPQLLSLFPKVKMSTEIHSTTSLSIQNLPSFQNDLKSCSSMVCPQTAPQCHCLEMPTALKAWFCTVNIHFSWACLSLLYSHKIVNPIRGETLKILHNISSSTKHILSTQHGMDAWQHGWLERTVLREISQREKGKSLHMESHEQNKQTN